MPNETEWKKLQRGTKTGPLPEDGVLPGTPPLTPIQKLAKGAALAAVSGPARRDKYTLTAGISHESLEMMREALDELGVDWRHARELLGRPAVKEVQK